MPFICIRQNFKIVQFTNGLATDKTSGPTERIESGEKHHRHPTDHCRNMPQEQFREKYNSTGDKTGRIRSIPVPFREIRRLWKYESGSASLSQYVILALLADHVIRMHTAALSGPLP